MAEITVTGSDQAAVQTPDTKKKVPDPKVAGRFGAEFTRIARAAAEREKQKAAEQAAGAPAGTPKTENRPASGPVPGETMPGTLRGPINFVNAPQTAGTAPNLRDPTAAAGDLTETLKNNPAAFPDHANRAGLADPKKMHDVVDKAVKDGTFWGKNTDEAAAILNAAAKSGDPKIRTNAYNESVRLAGDHGDTSALKEARKNAVANDTGAIAASAKTMDEKGKAAFVDASFDALHDVANNDKMSEADKKASAQRILQGLGAVIPETAPKDQTGVDATTKDVAQRLAGLSAAEKDLVYPLLAGTAKPDGN